MEDGTGTAAFLLEAWTPSSGGDLVPGGGEVVVSGRVPQYVNYPPTTMASFIVVYILGVLGNTAALLYLYGSKSKPRNPKHALMLRCLAANDLVAVLGNLLLFFMARRSPKHLI